MPDYQLYCFAQSGNSYKAALMLALIGARWKAIHVDFFHGETRSAQYRENVNAMGEVPVLVEGTHKLSQSGAILTYLKNPENSDRIERTGGSKSCAGSCSTITNSRVTSRPTGSCSRSPRPATRQ